MQIQRDTSYAFIFFSPKHGGHKNMMIHRNLVFTNLCAKDKEDTIRRLAGHLLQAGYVKDTYLDAVLQREKEYPTGLDLGDYCIAMPHTFAAHVNEPALAIAKLASPVICYT